MLMRGRSGGRLVGRGIEVDKSEVRRGDIVWMIRIYDGMMCTHGICNEHGQGVGVIGLDSAIIHFFD